MDRFISRRRCSSWSTACVDVSKSSPGRWPRTGPAFRAFAGDLKLAYAQFEELNPSRVSGPVWMQPPGVIDHVSESAPASSSTNPRHVGAAADCSSGALTRSCLIRCHGSDDRAGRRWPTRGEDSADIRARFEAQASSVMRPRRYPRALPRGSGRFHHE